MIHQRDFGFREARVHGNPNKAGADDTEHGGVGDRMIGAEHAGLAAFAVAAGAQCGGDLDGDGADIVIRENVAGGRIDQAGGAWVQLPAMVEEIDRVHAAPVLPGLL